MFIGYLGGVYMKKIIVIVVLFTGLVFLSTPNVLAEEMNNLTITQTQTNVFSGEYGGTWVYQYTAEPYAFYKHTGTGQWKAVQVTPNWEHAKNVVVNGWISSLGNGNTYATSWGKK